MDREIYLDGVHLQDGVFSSHLDLRSLLLCIFDFQRGVNCLYPYDAVARVVECR